MYIRVYIHNFWPPSFTTASILMKALLQAFDMVSLGREAIIPMIFNIREATEFFGWLP